VIDSLWRNTKGNADELLKVSIYQGSSIQAGREWLRHTIAALPNFEDVAKRDIDLTDTFFTLDEGVIFSIHNVVVSLVSLGNVAVSLVEIAQVLAAEICQS
jgi:hypothetical protein